MALYDIPEFASYVQVDQAALNAGTAELLLTLVTGLMADLTGKDYTDASTAVTATEKAIALEAAARPYRNPTGITAKTESVDDWSETDRWSADGLGVYLTDAEQARLLPDADEDEHPWSGTLSIGTRCAR